MTSNLTYSLISNGNEPPYYELKFNNGNTCKIDINSLTKIQHIKYLSYDFIPTWYSITSGYIACSTPSNQSNIRTIIYMHRYLMNQFQYDGKISVDHINRDKSDNRMSNLRLATQSTQNHNRSLPERDFVHPEGFAVEFQLPQYIQYVKEEIIKTTINGKEVERILMDHFRVASSYLGFEKHASKSSKLTIQERLSDALQKRYHLIVESGKDIKDIFVDGYSFKTFKEFEDHTLEYIKILCGIDLTEINDEANDFPEEASIKRNNLPKYVSYLKGHDVRGSKLSYEKFDPETKERIRFTSSGSKIKSLDDKLEEIITLMKDNKVNIIWDKKPSFIDDNNNFIQIKTQSTSPKPSKSNNEFSEEWLTEIQDARNTKNERSDNINPVDIIIMKKLHNDNISNSKNTIASTLQINYNIFNVIYNYFTVDKNSKDSNVNKNDKKQRYQLLIDNIESNFSKLCDDFLNYSNSKFMTEYDKIKSEIIDKNNNNKKLSGLIAYNAKRKANRFGKDDDKDDPNVIKPNIDNIKEDIKEEIKEDKDKPNDSSDDTNNNDPSNFHWKYPLKTMIKMMKDKGTVSYSEMAKKYTDRFGKQATLFDIQNICNVGHSYNLTEDDFKNRTDMTFEEYTNKRKTKIGMSSVKAMNKAKIDESGKKQYTEKELITNMKTGISKRTCDSETMIDIFKDKYSVLNALDTSRKYKNKKGDPVSEAIVKQIWAGATELYECDFENRNDITYQQYKEDIPKKKTEFSRILEYQDKLKNLQDGIENGTIKSLTRTHLSVISHCGYGDDCIKDLNEKIKKKLE